MSLFRHVPRLDLSVSACLDVGHVSVSVSARLGSRTDYFCVCLVFALHSMNTFVHFPTHLTKKSSFPFIIWVFKENLTNLASSTSKICQLTRSDKKHNARKVGKTKIQKTEGKTRTRLSRSRIPVLVYA